MRSSQKPSPSKAPRPIDRVVPGLGRLTIRTARLSADARDDLDRLITRAVQGGHLEQLQLLRGKVTPHEFLAAGRSNKLLALRPQHLVRPLVAQWLDTRDLRRSSRIRYQQSWNFMFDALPSDATLEALTDAWWEDFAVEREVGNATLNRDRAALSAFRTWATEVRGYTLPEFNTERRIEEPQQSEILTPEQIDAVRRYCRPDRWPFFWALFDTGARQGEALNLVPGDIHPYTCSVRFPSRPGSKNRGKHRDVPVSLERWGACGRSRWSAGVVPCSHMGAAQCSSGGRKSVRRRRSPG
jgi:integrase